MAGGDEKRRRFAKSEVRNSFKTSAPELGIQSNRKLQYIEFHAHGHTVLFDAFITSMGLGVGSAAEPESNPLIGEANMFLFNGPVTRKISLSFKTVAYSASNAKSNLQKLGLLHLMAFPETARGEQSGFEVPQATIMEVRFMNILQGEQSALRGDSSVKAHVSDLNYEFDMDAGFIEDVERKAGTAIAGNVYPKVVNVNVDFIVMASGIGWETTEQAGSQVSRPRQNSLSYPFGIPYNAKDGDLIVDQPNPTEGDTIGESTAPAENRRYADARAQFGPAESADGANANNTRTGLRANGSLASNVELRGVS